MDVYFVFKECIFTTRQYLDKEVLKSILGFGILNSGLTVIFLLILKNTIQ